MDYLAVLNGIPYSMFDERSRMDLVPYDAWVWFKPQLRVELRYIRKKGTFWTGCKEASIAVTLGAFDTKFFTSRVQRG